eukprot:Rhum_TRINITY_DN14584_c17_g1::Rhum_TRINITY_DN14584_c17_g1_i1::g.100111::m.100111
MSSWFMGSLSDTHECSYARKARHERRRKVYIDPSSRDHNAFHRRLFFASDSCTGAPLASTSISSSTTSARAAAAPPGTIVANVRCSRTRRSSDDSGCTSAPMRLRSSTSLRASTLVITSHTSDASSRHDVHESWCPRLLALSSSQSPSSSGLSPELPGVLWCFSGVTISGVMQLYSHASSASVGPPRRRGCGGVRGGVAGSSGSVGGVAVSAAAVAAFAVACSTKRRCRVVPTCCCCCRWSGYAEGGQPPFSCGHGSIAGYGRTIPIAGVPAAAGSPGIRPPQAAAAAAADGGGVPQCMPAADIPPKLVCRRRTMKYRYCS